MLLVTLSASCSVYLWQTEIIVVGNCCSSEDVEKEACFILGLLAIKPEHQHSIADMGALAGLVGILKRHIDNNGAPMPGASVVRRAADAITNLAHENVPIKSRVRAEEGIPPLVTLLEAYDAKVSSDMCSKSSFDMKHAVSALDNSQM